jgi:hypothetical protein
MDSPGRQPFFGVLAVVLNVSMPPAARSIDLPAHFLGVDLSAPHMAVMPDGFWTDPSVTGGVLDASALDMKRMGFNYVLLYWQRPD